MTHPHSELPGGCPRMSDLLPKYPFGQLTGTVTQPIGGTSTRFHRDIATQPVDGLSQVHRLPIDPYRNACPYDLPVCEMHRKKS